MIDKVTQFEVETLCVGDTIVHMGRGVEMRKFWQLPITHLVLNAENDHVSNAQHVQFELADFDNHLRDQTMNQLFASNSNSVNILSRAKIDANDVKIGERNMFEKT
jgi:hypothetical protein